MLAIREEELNRVNGGLALAFAGAFGGSKFNEGDRVISKTDPGFGVGTVVGKEYHRGWFYMVVMGGGLLYASEDDLVSPQLR